jgi:type IV secretion system protein VirB9
MKTSSIILATLLAMAHLPCMAYSNEDLAQGYFLDDSTPLTPQQQAGLDAAAKGKAMQSVKPITTPDGTVRFPFGLSRPVVVCAVLQVCDIELQPGEEIIGNPQLGDPRFSLEPVITGADTAATTHLIIKPFDVGLKTSLVIPTDRRIYHIELRSHLTDYMPKVGFLYPQEQKQRLEAARQKTVAERQKNELPQTGEYLGDLDFNYRVNGDAPWRPIRVYNDGRKTIIQMPSSVGQTEAPVFMVLRGGGWFSEPEKVVVNYRIQGDRYIVDALFDRGALFSGVGGNERSVEIVRGK